MNGKGVEGPANTLLLIGQVHRDRNVITSYSIHYTKLYDGTSNLGLLKTVYRRGLGYRYGRAMQAIAGVHFNYSPPQSFWPAYRSHRRSDMPLDRFRSEVFMGLVRNYRRHAWAVTYLFGASPAFCKFV